MLDQITVFGIISLINFLTCVFIGTFLLYKNTKNPINVSYCIFDFCIAFYAFFYFLWQSSSDRSWGVLFFKWCIFGVVLINSAFVHFTYVILGLHRKHRNQLLFVHAINAFFCYGSLALFYDTWKIKYSYGLWPIPSTIFHFYITWWFLQVIYCFYLLSRRGIAQSTGKQKRQYQWIFWATLIAYAGGATNWFVWYDIGFPPYLNSGIAIYTVVLAYAIFRHQLLDIEVFIKKTLVFAGIVAAAVSVIAFPFALIQAVIGKALGVPDPFILMALGIATTVLIYRPVERILVNVTDKYLFQTREDFKVILNRLSGQVITILDIKELSKTILGTLESSLRLESGAILVQGENQEHYSVLNAFGIRGDELKLAQADPLVRFFKAFQGIVNLEDTEMERKFPATVKERLARYNAVIAVPLFIGRDLIGILFLGKKKSDQEYTQDEIEYFPTVAGEVAIALSNARHYDEAVKRQKEAEQSREEALEAKKKTEEMQLELIRREKLLFVEKLVKGLAHEIFNPMTPMLYRLEYIERAYTELFLLFDDLRAQIKEDKRSEFFAHFKTIQDAVEDLHMGMEHIKRIVDTLNQLQHKDDRSIKPFDFKTFWKITYPMLEMETHGEGFLEIPVLSNVPKGLPPVVGNSTQLTQVFINLFRNSIHAMNGCADKRIEVHADIDPENKDYLRVRFSDTGCGIAPDILPKIFDFQFTTKGSKGQGIGLNQCKLIIEKFFKGSIDCESNVGKGTAFIIRLPVWKGENNADQATDS